MKTELPQEERQKMKIAFIGAGRLASNLAPALQAAGNEVVEVWSRSRVSAEALAARLGCRACWGTLDKATREADLYLICVRDAVLAEVIGTLHTGREQVLFAHTAGSMPLSLFADVGHARGGVFYPLQTFSKERQVDFRKVHFFLETSGTEDWLLLRELAASVASPEHIHKATSADRRHLHLAAVFACNFANHCFALADEVMKGAGLPFEAMLPLIEETVQKLHELSPREAQTGPAIRHDANVVGMQRSMLLQRPDLLQVYNTLTKSIQQLETRKD